MMSGLTDRPDKLDDVEPEVDEELDELDPVVVEDLDVDEDADDIRGGTLQCITM